MAGSDFARRAEEAQVNLRGFAFLIGIVLAGSVYVNLEVTSSMKAIAGAVARVPSAAAPSSDALPR